MDWLNHPSYKPLRDRLIARFRERFYTFKTLRPSIFLCGGMNSQRRDRLADYIRKHHPVKLLFYADDVWAQLAYKRSSNALQIENELAKLADIVVIVVESPGTFAELGAFSLSDELRKKLLPIVDVQYKDANSFINTGPLTWIDVDSAFRPTVYVSFSVILDAVQELDDRLARLPTTGRESGERVENNKLSPRHLLFLLCDLLAVIGPASENQCQYYLTAILEEPPAWSIDNLLSLGLAMNVLKHIDASDSPRLYYRPLENGDLQPFLHQRSLNLSSERARFLNVLTNIKESSPVINFVGTV